MSRSIARYASIAALGLLALLTLSACVVYPAHRDRDYNGYHWQDGDRDRHDRDRGGDGGRWRHRDHHWH
jgi:hypothetical protein